MSGAGEKGWRRSTQGPQRGGQQNPRGDRSGYSSPRPDGSRQSGNAWGGQDKNRAGNATGGGGAGGQDRSRNTQGGAGAGANAAGVVEEQHVPVKDFNAAEVKEALKAGYHSAAAGDRNFLWKPSNEAAPAKTAPWASKPNTMADGRSDFLVQLRKQISALEQSKT